MGILLTLTASQMIILMDGFRHQQSPGEIRQGFWLMHSCSITSWEAAWEAGHLHKPGSAVAHGPNRTATGRTGSPSKKLSSRVSSGNRDGTWPCWVLFRLPLMQALQRDGGSPDNSWLEQSKPGTNPQPTCKGPHFTLWLSDSFLPCWLEFSL